VERQLADRLEGFAGRLDAALGTFRTVARLNSDDVAAVRRVLQHLDGQRAAIGRVSPGLQAQLFAALADAEAKLEALGTAFEATRAIADQLVSGNAIDELLGSFDALFGGEGAAPAATPARARPAPWLDAWLALEGVDGAVVVGSTGRPLAGGAPAGVDPEAAAASIEAALAGWTTSGARPGDVAPELARLDAADGPSWIAPLDDLGYVLVWSRDPSTGDRLRERLRDDRAEIVALLGDALAGTD
jgi:hypothetical protein